MSSGAGEASEADSGRNAGDGSEAGLTAKLLALVLDRSPRTLTELADALIVQALAAAPIVEALAAQACAGGRRHSSQIYQGGRNGCKRGP